MKSFASIASANARNGPDMAPDAQRQTPSMPTIRIRRAD
jgi:hypothetical protein